jgi:peptide/nickel transport system substrate-binding protein
MSDTRISDLVGKLWSGEITRRDFMKRAAAAGMGASVVSAALSQGTMAAPGAKSGGSWSRYQADASTLVIADSLIGNQWLTLDPAWFYEINSTAAMNLVYEPLYHIPDGTKPTEIVPLLATDFPSLSEDSLVATITLRQGVKFHTSGNEMTSADVIFSWARLKNIGFQGSFFAIDYWTDVKAVDDYTIQITLPAPNAALAAILTSMPLAITDSARIKEFGGTDATPAAQPTPAEGQEAPKSPEVQANEDARDQINGDTVGTGPYKGTGWDKSSEVTLEAHADYWGEAPKLSQVIWSNTAEANAQVQRVQIGEVDIAYSLPPDQVEGVKGDANLQLLTANSLALCYMGLNTVEAKGGPLAKKEVRQAIGYALDYDGYINSIMGGAAVKPATAVPLPLTGSEAVKDKGYTHDVAKAQQLWDSAGVGDQEITVSYDTDTVAPGGASYETIAVKVKSDLEQIKGLKIKLAPAPGDERLAAYRAGDFQATLSPWTPDYPDVDSYCGPFARSNTAAAKRVGYSDPEVDKLLDQGLSELDPTKREAIYVQIQEKMIDAAAFHVLYQPVDQKAARAVVQGATCHPVYQLQLRPASKTG